MPPSAPIYKNAIQQLALALHGLVVRTGLSKLRIVQKTFLFAYLWYKERIEAGPIDALQAWIQTGSLVVDVGANVGFFTGRFAQWVGERGHVIAIEPDAENFLQLGRQLSKSSVANRVTCLRAVAADRSAKMRLARNELHPGDHKLSTDGTGVEVDAVTIDDVISARLDLVLSMVKIDVQGAEMIVLAGAAKTLADRSSAFFVEVDETALRSFGASSIAMFDHFDRFGYQPYELLANGSASMLNRDSFARRVRSGGYFDALFLKRQPKTETRS
jgi:FkbM family methyltransferase